MTGLVLSIFPGADFLGHAFELEGYCVVRGPDVLWGGRIQDFTPVSGPWAGVIGGPPCQVFSRMRHLNPLAGQKHGNLIPEYERVVATAQPLWFVMENVPDAPEPVVPGYIVRSLVLNNRWLGEVQDRTRRFSFGTRDGLALRVELAVFESPDYRQAVTRSARAVPVKIGGSGKVKRTFTEEGKRRGPDCGPRASIRDMLRLQGMPEDWLDECPLTESGKRLVVGNAVPLPMGRAIARAVKRALQQQEAAS